MYIGPILNSPIRSINDITYYPKAFDQKNLDLLEELVKGYEFKKGETGIREFGNIDSDSSNNRNMAVMTGIKPFCKIPASAISIVCSPAKLRAA